ncbi:MAG: ABC transporter permease [Proteobacteria bacterium]|jgi:putative ABC transport system permease protein|nr:ABC transporter permease [Pseudomonadota bacterium]
MSLRAILRNKMRSSLTILGIVIGVGAVVALVTIGQGATAQVQSQIGALGTNLLTLQSGAERRPGEARAAADPLEIGDATAIRSEIDGIAAIAPVASSNALAVNANVNWQTSITGTTAEYLECRGYKLASGRVFSDGEESSGALVCVVGATVVKELFAGEDPVGQRIRVGRISCSVIGVLAAKGQAAMGMDQDDIVLIPIRAFQRRVAGNDDISRIEISVAEGRSTGAVRTGIESLMRDRRRVEPGGEDNFRVRDMAEIASAMAGTTTILTTLLSAIAAVSLLVGGIGIMNIMLVSVTERTREIGIRLAIGATGSEVMTQFLVEAAALSGLGGLIGLALGNLGAFIATRSLEMPFSPSAIVAAIAFVFSVLVGIVFGYLPAKRASRLNPIEALRHE